MNRFALFCYYFLLLASIITSTVACKKEAAIDSADIIETKPAVLTATSVTVNDNIGGYYIALPARYDSTTKKYPMLVFLHGSGEMGNGTTNLPSVLSNATPRLLNQKTFPPSFTVDDKSYSFIVVIPQFKRWPSAGDVNSLIDQIVSKFRVDPARLYLSGLSMGGGATWDYAAAYPKRLAAIVPICGASSPNDNSCKDIASANLPVWAFHNNDDGTVAPVNSVDYVNKINSNNPSVKARLTLWPTGGHDAWTKATDPAYKEDGKNMYEWMLQYSR